MEGRSENSRRTYQAIVANGLLSRGYLKIYSHIYEHGATTRNKLDMALCPGKANPWPSRRLVEMERMGALTVVGQDNTGEHQCDLWDLTERLPVKLEKKPSSKEAMRRGLKEIVAALDALEAKVSGEAHMHVHNLRQIVARMRGVLGE
jgi:hypothetical protein